MAASLHGSSGDLRGVKHGGIVASQEDSPAKIKFVAEVARIQTLVDGGLRVTLDLPETAIAQAAMLMECKRLGILLSIIAKEVDNAGS